MLYRDYLEQLHRAATSAALTSCEYGSVEELGRAWPLLKLQSSGRVRLVITALFVLLAILLARYSWGYPSAATAATERGWVPPIAIDAERALYDTRAIFTALRYTWRRTSASSW